MNGLFITPEVNGARPFDFQHVAPNTKMLGYLFAFYAANLNFFGNLSAASISSLQA
jgi:hypothetical protein